MKNKSALIIFVKNPLLGKVKTRLANTVGDENALLIYQKLLERTHEITSPLECSKYVFYSDFIDESDIWENEVFNKRKQIGHDLGERMSHAFQSLFDQGYEQLVIIGSDAYDLESRDIEQAFNQLTEYDCIIGPALDGGYYLLGLREMVQELFEDKSWSSAGLIDETEETLNKSFKTYKKLRFISDIDHESDLGSLKRFVTFDKEQ